jgi:hypothetical protein
MHTSSSRWRAAIVTTPSDGVRTAVIDRDGVNVVVSEERWLHIVAGHEEIAAIEAEIAAAIRRPEIVRDGRTAGEAWLDRRLPDASRAPWLKVVVRYGEEGGRVLTAFLRRRVP